MSLRHLPCFAHTLNLVMQDAMSKVREMQVVKNKVKQIVTYFHHSVKASDKLRELQQQHGVPVKKLIQDVETRWNSTFYMLERFTQQSDLITTTLCLLGRNDLCLTGDEISLVTKAVAVLEYFDEATREFSSEKFTSLSKVIPIVRGLQDSLQDTDDMEDQMTSQNFLLSEELSRQLSQRFSKLEGTYMIGAATILDPRFKKIPFSDSSNIKAIEERLLSVLRSKYSNNGPDTSLPQPEVSQEPRVGKKTLWKIFDTKAGKTAQVTSNPTTEVHIELWRYFEEPRISRCEDPLSWWEKKSAIFPNLSEIARKILSVPASSVPSQRLFSKAGELISQRRSTLKDENVNMILLLNKNM